MKQYKAAQFAENGIHIFRPARPMEESVHTHDFLELVYVFSGTAVQQVGEHAYPVRRGDLVFINYGQTHAFQPTDAEFAYCNIIFQPDFISSRLIAEENAFETLLLTAFDEFRGISAGSLIHFSGAERQLLETILEDMLAERSADRPGSFNILSGYMCVIFTKLLRKLGTAPVEDGVWQELLRYIDDNLGEQLTLPALAERCFYNPSYFSRVFRKKYGKTLLEYINDRRLVLAAQQLDQTEDSIEQICLQCGWQDKTTFYRNFHRKYGLTPAQYRKK